ncbi:hypothetical protein C8R47DRAFT_984428, partial [Mycena vitilis]
LWFSPDVVILRAQTRTFRVFVDILKEKSSVFADMFTLPQPLAAPSGMETIDGVPVVNVHDDPVEMEAFLKAIFDSAFFMPPPAQNKISQTLGILRLAHKYDVPYLRRRALEHMGTVHPTRLSGWNFARMCSTNSDKLAQRIATIQTATEVGALWLLPTAYYDICRRQLSTFIDDPSWIALGNKERRACMLGYQAQIQQTAKIVGFLCVANENCEEAATCNRNRLVFTHYYPKAHGRNAPLECWSEAVWNTIAGRICGSCVGKLKPLQATARQQCWDNLPEMFGLPSWGILENMRAAALAA